MTKQTDKQKKQTKKAHQNTIILSVVKNGISSMQYFSPFRQIHIITVIFVSQTELLIMSPNNINC